MAESLMNVCRGALIVYKHLTFTHSFVTRLIMRDLTHYLQFRVSGVVMDVRA